MSQQLSCYGMCKIVTWSDDYFSFLQDLDHTLLALANHLEFSEAARSPVCLHFFFGQRIQLGYEHIWWFFSVEFKIVAASVHYNHKFFLFPFCVLKLLAHWGWVTHICVSKLAIIGSDIGLSPRPRLAIIWTNAGILLFGNLGTNFGEIFIEILPFSF